MAAGRGTRMRSRLPKVLHPLCGRPMLLWPVEAAREAGAERIVVVLGDEAARTSGACCRPTSRSRSRIRRPAPATRCSRRATRSAARERRDRAVRRPPAAGRRASSPRSPSATPRSGAAATVTTRELEDPGQYGRIVRDADGDDRADRRDQERRATPRPRSSRSRRSTPAPTRSPSGPLFEALEQRAARTTPRARCTSGDALPLLRAAGHRVVAHLTDDEAVSLGINTRADLAQVQALRPAPDPARAAHARGRDDRRSRLDLHRCRRADRRGHDRSSPSPCCAAAPRSGRAARVGPMTTLIDCAGRRGRARWCTHT